MRIFILSPQTIVCVDILVPEVFSLLPNSRKVPRVVSSDKVAQFCSGGGGGTGTGEQKNISFR